MTTSNKTTLWLRPLAAASLATVLAFSLNACKSNSPATNATDASGAPDAADGNLAPVDGSQPTAVLGQSASYTPQQQGESYQQAPAPVEQGYAQAPDDSDQYNSQDVSEYATEPPPPLPDYDQPPAPDPNYIWTPGYWGWGDAGYYWVPGVWCPPPYYGALWTPPYWGFYGGRYGFHHGYWGLHIGFYGGVDYGFGYIGTGYFGGYWHGNDFYYNRAVTNVNFNTNVYSRDVVYNGHSYGRGIQNRVSYNGGNGGINVRPRPAEVVAMRETHVGPIAAQTQVRTQASTNRAQFYNTNHGRPAQTAFARPTGVPAGAPHIAEAPAAVRQEQQRSVQVQQRNVQMQHPEQRPGATAPGRGPEPQRAAEPQRGPEQRPVEPQRNVPAQQHAAPVNQQHMETRPAPAAQAPRPEPARPETRPQPAARPQPEARPAPAMRPEPAMRPQPEARPQPAPRPEAAPRPAPAPRAAPAPAPRAAPAPRPAPAPHPAPAARPEEHR